MTDIFSIKMIDIYERNLSSSQVVDSLGLQKKYHEARMERDKELSEWRIKIADAQIDRLIYKLYGLTEEEIVVIEGEQSLVCSMLLHEW